MKNTTRLLRRIHAVIVAAFVAGGAQPARAGTATIDTTTTYQTMEGLGGAVAFYAGWVSDHPYKLEIYTNAFADLNLSMLRLGDWYRYNANFDQPAGDIVSNANRVLGHPVPIYISSWSPPAFLKSNGQTANGGTLIITNGGYDYTGFAQYWYDSIQAYGSIGVSPTWISIQNEPDWTAGYDSCRFDPTETTNASYSLALDATFQLLSSNMTSPPKLLGPECVGIGYNDVQNYAATMNGNSFYGLTHHLYGGSTDGSPDGYIANMAALTNVFPTKPHFMTEYGYPDMINTACLIHDCLTVEQDVGFNYWSLVWPFGGDGLVQIENPYASPSTWTNAPPGVTTDSHGWWLSPAYWAMKHFSYFVQPGFRRVSASDNDIKVRTSAFLSPDNFRLVVVLINTNSNTASTMVLNYGSFNAGKSSVYQTAGTNTYAGTNTFLSLGSLGSSVVLPPLSITTVVLDQLVSVGPASNPSPANNATGVSLNPTLSWSSGSNASTHAVYFGTNSNAVAQATMMSPQYQGTVATNNFVPVALTGATTYFWRVDEISSVSTNTGTVWSFTTMAAPAVLAHRYSFNETGGTVVDDSVGGPAWNGTLPRGGTFANGALTLTGSSSQYVLLPPGILSNYTAVTIDLWATIQTGLPTYCYLFSFGNTDSGGNGEDYIFLSPQFSRVTISAVDPGYGAEQGGDFPTLAGANEVHVTSVFNPPAGVISVYTNGVLTATFTGITDPMSSVAPQLGYIGRSLYVNDSYFTATYDEFRIYGGPLTAAQVAANQALGPSLLTPPNLSVAMVGSNVVVSWPTNYSGFSLGWSGNPGAGGSWNTVGASNVMVSGANYQVMLQPTNTAQFFRLSK